MRKVFLYILVFVLGSASAQTGIPEELKKSISERIENGHSPSIVIGIIDKKGPSYYLFGTKSIGGEKVDEHTIYEIGSISKTFTGILLADMALNKKVKIEDPAQKYLPESVKMPVMKGSQITLGNLSDHTSGLARMPSNLNPANPENPYADYTVDQMYAFLNSFQLTREIGSEYEYSNLAQGLLGHILSLVSKDSYENLVLKKIAQPLGMKETKISLDDHMKKNLAVGHNGGKAVANWDIPTLAGAGALRSSLHDMLIYVASNAGIKKTKLASAMALSHKERHAKQANGNRVGLGWHTAKGAQGDVIWHTGGTGGYRTFAGFVKETGKGVVVLTNSNRGADDIGFYLLDSNRKLNPVKKSGLTFINSTLEEKGSEAAWSLYQEKIKTNPEIYEISEDEINTMGYTYLQGSKIKEALTLFKINVDAFPSSSNVYDSYGEALMVDGQKEASIENYKKSLELNPGNANGEAMLAKMGIVIPKKEIIVDEKVLESLVGVYQLAPNFNIAVTRESTRLFAQATGQSKFELFPNSSHEFYLKVVEARIIFSKNEGKASNLTLFQGGREMPGKRIE